MRSGDASAREDFNVGVAETDCLPLGDADDDAAFPLKLLRAGGSLLVATEVTSRGQEERHIADAEQEKLKAYLEQVPSQGRLVEDRCRTQMEQLVTMRDMTIGC